MRKKPRKPTNGEQTDSSVHILKLRLTPAQMRLIRIAAAIEDKQPGVFIRDLAMERAKQIAAEFRPEVE